MASVISIIDRIVSATDAANSTATNNYSSTLDDINLAAQISAAAASTQAAIPGGAAAAILASETAMSAPGAVLARDLGGGTD